MAEEDIDALAAAAHGFVGADLAAVCDEAAMAALRRIIASKQHSSADPPTPLPFAHPQAKESYASSNEQHPARSEAQVTAQDQRVSSPQCRLTPTKPKQQTEGTSPKTSLTGRTPDSGVAGSSEDTSSCVQPSGSISAHAEPSGETVGSARPASRAHGWQVRQSMLALTMQFPLWQGKRLLKAAQESGSVVHR